MSSSNLTIHAWPETADDGALELCRAALHLAGAGDGAGALGAISPLWGGVGSEPKTDGYKAETAAEVIHCAGTLMSVLDPSPTAQRSARRLLRRAARVFRSLGDGDRSARSAKEFAASCLRSGRYSHALKVANTCLGHVESLKEETEAEIRLVAAIAEWGDHHLEQALTILEDAFPLFETIPDDRFRGTCHSTLGLVLRGLGMAHGVIEYLQRAFIEYTAAEFYFESAGSVTHLSSVANNLGFLQMALGRHADAHPHLDRARELAHSTGDEVQTARVDETRARLLNAEGRLVEAEQVIENAIGELERLGATSLLPEAFATRDEIKARIAALKPHTSNVVPFGAPLANLPDRYVVTVSDASLINAGIEAGDSLWLCRASEAQDGDLVFASTPDCIVIAFFYRDGGDVRLIFAHENCPARAYPANVVRIRGVALNR